MIIDFKNQEVLQEFNRWGKWYLDTTGINGMRLDAVKHIDNQFFKNWLSDMRAYKGENFFAVGEYWMVIWVSYRSILRMRRIVCLYLMCHYTISY